MDAVFLTINGKTSYRWRAVDQDGNVLDILVQRQRDTATAKTFFRKLLKGCQYVARVLITDKWGSDEAAKQEVMPSAGTANIRTAITGLKTSISRRCSQR